MTLEEAREQVDECEKQITDTYSDLYEAARSMSSNAVLSASSKTSMCIMLPLLISLVGLVFCFSSHPIWGIILIILGIGIAYCAYQSAVSVQRDVERQVKRLNDTLDCSRKI